ncbi:lipoprotein [Pseudomonas fildesensis]|uniref:Lipoprotein n=1 Tax=Pseudomonas fildesensis TaxID=1674920 RepID=A0A0J8IZJ7_9PSED|nr:lipoprotein [Pseudomonas fildesensis]KMT57461.1 lipoprotein [Pseudomonas fildesensis]
MKAWRVVVIALSFLLLSGCLVTFKEPLPAQEAAPKELLGQWSSKNAWGEPLNLQITRVGEHRYKAVSYPKTKPGQRDEYLFTVSRHGDRWYLSAPLPSKLGGNFILAGFELDEKHELVVYNLDLEQIRQAIGQKALHGSTVETVEGTGVLVDSPMDQVFAYLDDPANADVFVEAVRYQRAGK